MYCKSAYHLAQHFTKSNRYLSYIHFSEASHESACRRVNGQIASYFHEIIVLSRKRCDPLLKYLCYTNLHTTSHNTSQNFIEILPTWTSQRRLKKCSPKCKRPNRKLFPRNNCSFPKMQWPIAKISTNYKSTYHRAQNFTKSNRYLTYIHFSEASQGSARRRVKGQIASYLHELIVLSRKRSNPSLKYLCFTNPDTTVHNTSQNLIDIFPTSTSQRRLMEVLAAV